MHAHITPTVNCHRMRTDRRQARRALTMAALATISAPLAGAGTARAQDTSPMRPPGMESFAFGPEASVELARVARVPLRTFDGARPAVHVSINGRGPYLFAIETGGPYPVVIDAKLATDLGLAPAQDAPLPDARRVDSLRIGTLAIRNMVVGTRPNVGLPGIDGMLGLDTFRDLLLTVDYGGNEVRLERGALPAANGRDIVPIRRMRAGLVHVDAALAGRSMPLVIDTQGGGPAISCNTRLADSLPTAAPPVVTGQALVGGIDAPPRTSYSGRLAGNVAVGGITFERPVIAFSWLPPAIGCILGIDGMRHFAMTLDQQSMRVRFSAPSLVVPPPPPVWLAGLGILPDATGTMRIVSVLPDAAAERAGARVGDEVVEVGGRPATWETSSPGAMRRLVEGGKAVRLTLRRGSELLTIDLTPQLVVP